MVSFDIKRLTDLKYEIEIITIFSLLPVVIKCCEQCILQCVYIYKISCQNDVFYENCVKTIKQSQSS